MGDAVGMNSSERSPSSTECRQDHGSPLRYIYTLYHLFFTRKFLAHRLIGLAYLLQYATAVILYFYDYQIFKKSPLIITLPVTGVIQSISAALTFTFLPKKQLTQGFFSSSKALGYDFVVENSFFALWVCFTWLYFDDFPFKVFQRTVIIENVFVFLPFVLRLMWPNTSFNDSILALKSKSDKNLSFFIYGTWVTKSFYVFGKHLLGMYLGYMRFSNRLSDQEIYNLYLIFILGSFSITISLFLHTLKFKGYIDPKTAFIPYVISYTASLYPIFRISETYLVNWDITILAALGIPINFCSRKLQIAYQVLLMIGFNAKRYGML